MARLVYFSSVIQINALDLVEMRLEIDTISRLNKRTQTVRRLRRANTPPRPAIPEASRRKLAGRGTTA